MLLRQIKSTDDIQRVEYANIRYLVQQYDDKNQPTDIYTWQVFSSSNGSAINWKPGTPQQGASNGSWGLCTSDVNQNEIGTEFQLYPKGCLANIKSITGRAYADYFTEPFAGYVSPTDKGYVRMTFDVLYDPIVTDSATYRIWINKNSVLTYTNPTSYIGFIRCYNINNYIEFTITYIDNLVDTLVWKGSASAVWI